MILNHIMKKIFVLLPDGVGFKNFALTKFPKRAKEANLELVYWNNTIFDLASHGLTEVKISNAKLHFLTEFYKNARIFLKLKESAAKFNSNVYLSYWFKQPSTGVKNKIKLGITSCIEKIYSKNLVGLGKKMKKIESQTSFFQSCMQQLKAHQPAVVFCTNQRASQAIAPIEAAKKLGIPTVCFIFSWDNLPKATLLISTDYYMVWSPFMKEELLKYYPEIQAQQIVVTGSPQFENHTDVASITTKEEFYSFHNLNKDTTYFCFSGDDVTTSPHDPLYLRDMAQAIQDLNQKGYHFGIIFRKSPADLSDRYAEVITAFAEIIVPIDPLWTSLGTQWNTIMPTAEDLILQANILHHTAGVVNLGSSMVFDAVCHQKPCAYVNYNHTTDSNCTWDIHAVYQYIHFNSMPNKKAVFWMDSPQQMGAVLLQMVHDNSEQLKHAHSWYEKINTHEATSQMINFLKQV